MRIDKAFCDNCSKEDIHKCFPVQMVCGYGSIFDGDYFDFCSDKCLVEFVQQKLEEVKLTKSYTLPLREAYEKKLEDVKK